MNPFDDKYLKQRKEQLDEQYCMRAVGRALIPVTIALGGLAVLALLLNTTLGIIVGVIAVITGIGAAITAAIGRAMQESDKQLQQETERLIALNDAAAKPKRRASTMLSDDGELIEPEEDDSESRPMRRGKG